MIKRIERNSFYKLTSEVEDNVMIRVQFSFDPMKSQECLRLIVLLIFAYKRSDLTKDSGNKRLKLDIIRLLGPLFGSRPHRIEGIHKCPWNSIIY